MPKISFGISIDSELEKELRRIYHKEMLKRVGKEKNKSFSEFVEFLIRKGLEAIKAGL